MHWVVLYNFRGHDVYLRKMGNRYCLQQAISNRCIPLKQIKWAGSILGIPPILTLNSNLQNLVRPWDPIQNDLKIKKYYELKVS